MDLNSTYFGHETLVIVDQTSDIGHGKSDIKHRTPDIGHQTSDIRHQTSDIEHRTSDIRNRALAKGKRKLEIEQCTSDNGPTQ